MPYLQTTLLSGKTKTENCICSRTEPRDTPVATTVALDLSNFSKAGSTAQIRPDPLDCQSTEAELGFQPADEDRMVDLIERRPEVESYQNFCFPCINRFKYVV